MKLDLPSLCNELIGALITGGAQGALIIGLVWLALKFTTRANAATRHGAWFATLLVVTLLPGIFFVRSIWPEPSTPAPAQAVEFTAPQALLEIEVIEEVAAPVELPFEPTISVTEQPTATNWALSLPRSVSLAIIGIWICLATIRLAGLMAQLWTLRRVKGRASAAPEILARSFLEIVSGMAMSRKPRLLISEEAPAPMVVGFLRPAMLLPKFVLNRSNSRQLEHLFRHELAHLARRDDWTNLVQQLIAAIFFFHPGVLFLSRRLTAEREIACDDHALAIGRAPREYALFLTEFASQMKGRDFTAAPAAWSSNSQLKERIGMILNTKRNASPRVSRVGIGMVTATVLGLAVAAMVATPRLVVASEEPVVEAVAAAPAAVAVTSAAPATVELSLATVKAVPAIEFVEPKVSVHVKPLPAPAPVKVAAAPEGGPRIKVKSRGDDDEDFERRLDRLERLVEKLAKRDHSEGSQKPQAGNFNKNFGPELDAQIHAEIERAHREADRAKREVERATQDQKRAGQEQARAGMEQDRAMKLASREGRESLKARRHALEAQRKQIEKEIQAIEKEMEKDGDRRGQSEGKGDEKRAKSDSKEDKKSRDNRNDSAEDGRKP
ncbi:MAG TPA: M56 family metallopeptidase [Verrucomicrobiae bacterium]|nr:M56 family metallopeptidase [Verrucomicrobiae bacterium]